MSASCHQPTPFDWADLVDEKCGEKTTAGACRSFGSMRAVIGLAQAFDCDEASALLELFFKVRSDPKALFTARAREKVLGLYPGEAFLKLVAAVRALDLEGYLILSETRHGWPVLSVVDDCITTVADGEAASSGLPESPITEQTAV